MVTMLKIAIGSDHGGFAYKEAIKKHLEGKYEVIDVGTHSEESCHYPQFGIAAAKLVGSGQCDFGIVVCTSGEGIMISANKVKGVRCAMGYNDEVSALSRQHNDANMIAFGQKFMALEDVLRRIDIFLSTDFEGGRHATRVQMIMDEEK
jgi:ribose 5-phosphate isomerase B